MEDNILDKEISIDKKKSDKNLLIPLAILWAALLWGYYLDSSIYLLCLILTTIATAAFFVKKTISFLFVLIVFLAGLFQIIAVFPYEVTFETLNLKFDILCLIGLIITSWLNRNLIKQFLNIDLVNKDHVSGSQIAYFKNRFSKKSTQELIGIRENSELVEEARIAAQKLLNER